MRTDTEFVANLLFPEVELPPEDIFRRFPQRKRTASAKVTRFAPSPTGLLTIGGLYATFISERMAHQSEGIFYVRIEDTDKKREVAGSVEEILRSLEYVGLRIDEGMIGIGAETGAYGPYNQSSRTAIYNVFIKHLLKQGLAYPCFCDENELHTIREAQRSVNATTGYYGKWAVHRSFTLPQIKQELDKGKPYVIRLKSPGSADRRITYRDLIKGEIELPENDQDVVIMKSDGIPTYHFAHAVDDCLMGTTHVIRGDEWIASVPIHLQLFDVLGFTPPEYGHLAPIMKMEGSTKRKFSKRKDPDAAVRFYREQGYPGLAISEYFMTLINSNYEEWRMSNRAASYTGYTIDMNKMNASGALFDFNKLNDIAKNTIAGLSSQEVYRQACHWAERYDRELHVRLITHPDYSMQIFNIGRNSDKPRKDLAKWSDVPSMIDYFFDDSYARVMRVAWETLLATWNAEEANLILERYEAVFCVDDDKDAWFAKLRTVAENHGFASNAKSYKNNPSRYKGHVGDVAMLLRIALTGRTHTPDLYEIMLVMGEDRVRGRLKSFAAMTI
ncbi:glutamate--tRNA ligase [Paenibacillus allorhizosphaerae]|uniref:Glutamate--tRNA ligase n=1 Tax=Paenibacillus allorhizosphaerae TaxID=2849866 RepID=A0ABN7T9M1_9BACL|nr:glutamate--tRNA ligase [Paenibacillus allorhizosphaerae]CAG7614476.1 Glutamate--tRNA ligase [Paenibacillus allorhizosphaerae]